MTETPLELEDDGGERDPDAGRDEQPIDFEAVPSEVASCARCERADLPVEPCATCGRDVCLRCASTVADDHRRCRVCG